MLSAEAARLGGSFRAMPVLFRLFHRCWSAVLTVSAGVADDIANHCRIPVDKIVIVPNPAARLSSTGHAVQARSGSGKRFVFAGRLVAQKDPALALHAFARSEAGGNSTLAILGEGPLRAELEEMARQLGVQSRVEFCGFVPDIAPWLRDADALLLTSQYEGFGNVLVEALAAGVPAIAADCPSGPAEILDNGRYGALFPVGDVTACASLMALDLRALFPAPVLRTRAAAYSVDRSVAILLREFTRAVAIPSNTLQALPRPAGCATRLAEKLLERPTGGFRYVVTLNTSHLRHMRRPLMAAACSTADAMTIDGAPVAWLCRQLTGASGTRLTGCALTAALAAAAPPAARIVAVVESESTAERLRAWCRETGQRAEWLPLVAEPGLRRNFAAQRRLVDAICRLRPTLLLMTLGAPVSEEFCYRYRESLPTCWSACVGQAVRVLIGATPRAPSRWRSVGMEWAWRLAHEPRRLAPRYALDALWLAVVAGRQWRARRAPAQQSPAA